MGERADGGGTGVQGDRVVPADQAEFQFGGDHRAPAGFLVAGQYLLQHMARVAAVG